jgi:hypothetical protein
VLYPNLRTHMLQFHNFNQIGKVKDKITTCCYCQKIFPSKSAVRRHVEEIHSNIETFWCQNCTIYFSTLQLKQEHYQKVHSGSFACIYCSNWSCTNPTNLSRHVKLKRIRMKLYNANTTTLVAFISKRKVICRNTFQRDMKTTKITNCSVFIAANSFFAINFHNI